MTATDIRSALLTIAAEIERGNHRSAQRQIGKLIDSLPPATVGGLLATAPARPISEWHEDRGSALWWRFPIDEPPYCGSPLNDDWPGYHTHWTPIVCPDDPATRGPIGAPNQHPDGCHTADATAPRDCTGDGHYECSTCSRLDRAGRAANGDPPIGGGQ